ncbi:hypothetical protein [Bacillus sp. Au-Bac7]|uniref:hypothetical protein n=1 Tax=Bacillus sp. Au-Bac7 TaxID=2906458 RepID=UPI001E6350BC|nr:hypothetical protein [Bacillus sp. Au-Bac7]MCE4052039.1 hypothetical protein [Bacillus sp. Au-Bac7]
MLEEVKYLQSSANNLLNEIKDNYDAYIRKQEIPFELKDKIREFLSKINDSLDYQAFIVFSKYCEKHVPEDKLENKKGQVHFPCRDTENAFKNVIKKRFPKLIEERSEIVELFKSVQPIEEANWLKYLNKLNNNNKHRFLTKQRKSTSTHIRNGRIGNTQLKNVTFTNCGVAPIKFGDENIDFITPSPYDVFFDFNTTVTYFFEEINQPVGPTLELIYDEAFKFTTKMEKLL